MEAALTDDMSNTRGDASGLLIDGIRDHLDAALALAPMDNAKPVAA